MTIRLRLAIWYGAAITITVAVVALVVWWQFSTGLRSTLDEALAVQVADARAALESNDERNPILDDPARPGIFTIVLDPQQRLLAASRSAPAGIIGVPLGRSTIRPAGATDDVALLAVASGDGRVVIAGSTMATIDHERERLAVLLGLVGLAAAIASVGGGWWLAGRALAPVALLVDELDRIHGTEGTAGLRLPVTGAHDELGRLTDTVNRMLARVERAIGRQRAFVAAASHDLRTPIAALRTELELALRRPDVPDGIRTAIVASLGDVRRLGDLADDLLGLAAAEDGGRPAEAEAVELRQLVDRVVDRVTSSGDAGRPIVDVELDVEETTILTDRVRLEQVLGNLVANAVWHSPAGATVTVRARCVPGEAGGEAPRPTLDVDVLDRGPGVPGAAVGTLFVPFVRSRPRGPGAGLGLATAAAAVRALGGRIGYRDRPGGGAWFWFRVPAASEG